MKYVHVEQTSSSEDEAISTRPLAKRHSRAIQGQINDILIFS